MSLIGYARPWLIATIRSLMKRMSPVCRCGLVYFFTTSAMLSSFVMTCVLIGKRCHDTPSTTISNFLPEFGSTSWIVTFRTMGRAMVLCSDERKTHQYPRYYRFLERSVRLAICREPACPYARGPHQGFL